MRHSLWPADTFVDFEHNLNSAVKRLRAALGDSADSPRFIETLPRRGYRFLVPVTVEPDAAPRSGREMAVVAAPSQPIVPDPIPTPRWDLRGWLAIGALVVIVGLFGFLLAGAATSDDIEPRRILSVAILPFENLSGDASQGYFADGLTEALIATLAQIEPLRVLSRAAVAPYRVKRPPIPELARRLGIDAIVEGSVVRDGDRVRITATLIDGRTDRHLWADAYDGRLSDVLALQNRVARQIALQVDVKLSPRDEARLSGDRPVDPTAYELYLRGRHLLNRFTEPEMRRGLEYFEQAILRDPNFALGHAGIAAAWEAFASWPGNSPKEAYPKAKSAALQALALDDGQVEALTVLAFIHETYDKDFTAAERVYQRAIALNPNYAQARQRYAMHLGRTARHAEALEQARRARDLDPLSIPANVTLGQALLAAGRTAEALERMLAAVELDPNGFDAHVHLAETYQRLGRASEAVAAAERAVVLSQRGPHALQGLAQVYARVGQTDRALRVVKEMESHPRRNPYDIALLYLVVGHAEDGLSWLRQACDDRSPSMPFLKTAQNGPEFDAVRNDPAFREILKCAEPQR